MCFLRFYFGKILLSSSLISNTPIFSKDFPNPTLLFLKNITKFLKLLFYSTQAMALIYFDYLSSKIGFFHHKLSSSFRTHLYERIKTYSLTFVLIVTPSPTGNITVSSSSLFFNVYKYSLIRL